MKKSTKKPAVAKPAPRKKLAAKDAQQLVETVAARHGIGQPKPAPEVAPPANEEEAAERFESRTGLKVKRSWAMLNDPKARTAKKTATKETQEGKPAAGRLNRILGHSACSIAKSLGAAGVKWEEADQIMRANGISMPRGSLSVQLAFGRKKETWAKRGSPAPISAAQIESLRAAASRPEAAA